MSQGPKIRLLRDAFRQFNRWAGVLKSDPYGFKLSLSQASALVDIDRYGPLKSSALVNLLKLEKSSVSRLVQTLIKRKLVELTAHEQDARAKLLSLTNKGQAMVRAINRQADNSIEQAFRLLSNAQQEQLVNSLTRFTDVIEGITRNSNPKS